ncbi:MAG TPA: kelch repeat-containing protein, partial [Candidatus Sulfotelmatobacter sp.]|nr:kelch repeat-containing protein [Candidatus Sulfotelmatobacter sp.]
MTSLSDCSPRKMRFADLRFSVRTFLHRHLSISARYLRRHWNPIWVLVCFVATFLPAAFPNSAAAQAPILQPEWNQLSPAAMPPERMGTSLAYDAAHAQAVMFGGFGYSTVLNDTWLWNGTNWTQANPANSPSARSAQTMAYDAATGQVVLFGGATAPPNSTRLGDTWLWNGTNWTQATPVNSPPARN